MVNSQLDGIRSQCIWSSKAGEYGEYSLDKSSSDVPGLGSEAGVDAQDLFDLHEDTEAQGRAKNQNQNLHFDDSLRELSRISKCRLSNSYGEPMSGTNLLVPGSFREGRCVVSKADQLGKIVVPYIRSATRRALHAGPARSLVSVRQLPEAALRKSSTTNQRAPWLLSAKRRAERATPT